MHYEFDLIIDYDIMNKRLTCCLYAVVFSCIWIDTLPATAIFILPPRLVAQKVKHLPVEVLGLSLTGGGNLFNHKGSIDYSLYNHSPIVQM